jgi:hypothetical protein
MACDAHAPLVWDSEPPTTFAQTPLPKSRRATLSTSICFIFQLPAGLTIPMYAKCSQLVVRLVTVAPREETVMGSFVDFADVKARCSIEQATKLLGLGS